MDEKELKDKIDAIFNDKSNSSIVPGLTGDAEQYDRLKIGQEIMKLASEDLKTKYEAQIESLAERFVSAIKMAESRIPGPLGKQEIIAIETDSPSEKQLLYQLYELMDKGYLIHSIVPDMQKRDYSKMAYIAICSKHE